MKLTFFEIGLFIAVPALAFTVTLGDTVGLTSRYAGLWIRWSAVSSYAMFSMWVLWRKSRPHPCFKFMSEQGIAVGWTQPIFEIDEDAFHALVEEYLTKAESVFPGARESVRGTTIIFREPVWYYRRKAVVGLQDNAVISVGWKSNLADTAIQHELGHRILQVLLGDPPEEESHEILRRNGLL